MRASDPRRFVAGDPLRGLAALSIAVYHVAFFTLPYTLASPAPPAEIFEAGYGPLGGPLLQSLQMGLFVFFVLSGYLISRPFVAWAAGRRERPALGLYVRNRLLRIVPAFWFAIALVVLLHGLAGGTADDLLALMFFAQTYHASDLSHYIGQGWTLAVELGFYALVPLAALVAAPFLQRFSARGRVAGLLAIAGAGFLASLALRREFAATLAQTRGLPTMLFAFMPGVALAALELALPARLARLRRPGTLAAGLVATGFVVIAVRESVDPERIAIHSALAALGAGLLVAGPLLLQWSGGGCWRALDNGPLQWLGERSYSLYVLHALIQIELLSLADGRLPWAGFILVTGLSIPICLLAAHISYHLIERPFLNLRVRQQPPIAARAARAPA